MESFTTPESVLAYLKSLHDPKFNGTSCLRLSGGFGNFVWRIQLEAPYRGHSTVVLKHAKDHAAANSNIPFGLDRMKFERDALAIFGDIAKLAIPPSSLTAKGDEMKNIVAARSSIVRLPAVFHADLDQHVLILEDAGDHPSLKTFLSQPPITPERTRISTEIGQYLGTFLALLHASGRRNDTYKQIFSDNQTARGLCAWRDAGRLKEGALKYGVSDARIQDIDELISKDIRESEETINMGDFWWIFFCYRLIVI